MDTSHAEPENQPAASVQGRYDPAFLSVAEVFTSNFEPFENEFGADPGDLGAALCVIADGQVVLNMWGGWKDRAKTRPWTRDTLVNAYSLGKAVTAVTILSLVNRGLLDLDWRLSKVWPQFVGGGKESITLRQALSHQAGLPGIRRTMAPEELFDFATMAAALAESEPWWTPGTAHGYHVNTLGHLAGEPVRRVTQTSLGQQVRELLSNPLEADLWIGLPRSLHDRVAEVDFVDNAPKEHRPHQGDGEWEPMRYAAYFNPPGLSGIGTVNTPQWREAEVPSTNLHTNAESVAKMFNALLRPATGPLRLTESLVTEAGTTHAEGHDLILDRNSRFGLGMMLPTAERPMGISEASFGHFGNGGSLGFVDTNAKVAFGYVINRPGDRWQTPRTRRILDALKQCF